MWVVLYIVAFFAVFVLSAVFKLMHNPLDARYAVDWSDSVGTVHADLAYGEGEANRFDVYLPSNDGKESYGLAVYLHAGGFTSGDKADDVKMLRWLCSKGYVAAGINYTLASEDGPAASVYSQSLEIRDSIPVVVAAAERLGYPIDAMAVGGGSAGHALAMIYAYRDGAQAPVPVKLTFGAVGPSGFHREDWGIYGLDESDEACAGMFSMMAGTVISPEEVVCGSYLEKVKPISAVDWIDANSPATVVAYGTHDKLQPFRASLRLRSALEEHGVDHRHFELPHSGHGLQNDNRLYAQWMDAVEEYLDAYLPTK